MTEGKAPRMFCTCAHSYWAHRVGFYTITGKRDVLYGLGAKLRHVCERTGCRCVKYTPDRTFNTHISTAN